MSAQRAERAELDGIVRLDRYEATAGADSPTEEKKHVLDHAHDVKEAGTKFKSERAEVAAVVDRIEAGCLSGIVNYLYDALAVYFIYIHEKMLKNRTVSMILLFLSAVFFAGIHHFFATKFDHRRADTTFKVGITKYPVQTFTSNWSVFFEKGVTFFLVTGVGFALVSMLWRRLRNTPATPQQIDSAFSVQNNFFAIRVVFTVPQLWFVACVALVLWAIPIVNLQTPAALGTKVLPTSYVDKCNITEVEWALTPDANFQSPYGTYSETELYFANGTQASVVDVIGIEALYPFEYEFSSIDRLAKRSLAAQSILAMTSPCGVNCSYLLPHVAPQIICNYSDYGFMAEYTANNTVTNTCGNDDADAPDCVCDPVDSPCHYWSSQYVSPVVNDDFLDVNTSQADYWNMTWPSGQMYCNVYLYNYTLNVVHNNTLDQPSVSINQTHGDPVLLSYPSLFASAVISTDTSGNVINSSQADLITHYTQGNVFALALGVASAVGTVPTAQDQNFVQSGAYLDLLSGYTVFGNNTDIELANFVTVKDYTKDSNLFYPNVVAFNGNITDNINTLLLNASLSLMSQGSNFTYINHNATCTYQPWVNTFVYNRHQLWSHYGPALGVCFVIMILGIICVARGEEHGKSFLDFAEKLKGLDIEKATMSRPDAKLLLNQGVSGTGNYLFNAV